MQLAADTSGRVFALFYHRVLGVETLLRVVVVVLHAIVTPVEEPEAGGDDDCDGADGPVCGTRGSETWWSTLLVLATRESRVVGKELALLDQRTRLDAHCETTNPLAFAWWRLRPMGGKCSSQRTRRGRTSLARDCGAEEGLSECRHGQVEGGYRSEDVWIARLAQTERLDEALMNRYILRAFNRDGTFWGCRGPSKVVYVTYSEESLLVC